VFSFLIPTKQMHEDTKKEYPLNRKGSYISKSFIEGLLDESRIEDIIGDIVDLKKTGSNFKGLSPFVEEQTPSFIVSPSKQIWKDFSSGKGGTSSVQFLMEKGMSFLEAIKHIAQKYGRSIQYENTEQSKIYQEELERINKLRPVLKQVIVDFQKSLKSLPKNHPAKNEVLNKRQYDQDIIDAYQIGFAPGNQFVYNKLKEDKLVIEGQNLSLLNGERDFFYERVTYTIFDANGEPIGISGRELKDPPKVKWLNPRKTILYDKDTTWYGLHIAKFKMRSERSVFIVEGYNDVIAFQTHGIVNTIASCGTSISDSQIKLLKRYVDVVHLSMDGDVAGKKSALKNIPRFIDNGLRCYVISFDKCDPDEFVRKYSEDIKEDGLMSVLDSNTMKTEGFNFLLNQFANEDDITKSIKAKEFCDLISDIDNSILGVYKKLIKEKLSVNLSDINGWIKGAKNKSRNEKHLEGNQYELPSGVEITDVILNDIKKYQMFQSKNQIFSQNSLDQPPYKFKSCSNFSVNIIQHMRDEAFPKKLISVENVLNQSFVSDVASDTFNSISQFQKVVTNFGNFRWNGNNKDLTRLQALLFDKMGDGKSLEVLGWQQEGFFLFNNIVVVPKQENLELDQNGCFEFKGKSYYVPSGNIIYSNNHYKYKPQKSFRHIQGKVTALEYFGKIHKVHGNHAISAIFHAIASLFHDVVASKLKGFPINFNQGPPSSGKDNLNAAVKSLWGMPQEATNLEGGNSTATAAIRELAQFNNGLMEWSEYKRGDSKLDGTIKALWDLRGKKIGTLDSRIATDNIPILCGVALTANDYPDNKAIITRVVWNDMNKTQFSEEEDREFNELNDMIDEGVTHITIDILEHRDLVENNFNKEYRQLMVLYQSRLPDCNSRMLKNISALTSFYNVLKDVISFPFNQNQILDHFTSITENQMRKLTTSSIISRWWDCFISSMRGTDQDKIKVGRDLKLEGSLLYFQFQHCYNKIQRQWFSQYRDSAPAKNTIKDSIKKDLCYVEYKKVVSFNTGANRNQSSAMVVDIMKLQGDLPDLLKAEVNLQLYEMNMHQPVFNSEGSQTSEDTEPNLPF
jgi:DNA primase catalytic core